VRQPPCLHLMPRVARDIELCVRFIARQPWGKPEDREEDIYRGMVEVLRGPKLNPVKVRRPSTGRELRRRKAAQFAIVYAYIPPNAVFPNGLVSIRAVRHRRVTSVFSGVKEPAVLPYGKSLARSVEGCNGGARQLEH
jgi:hypothetical protein